MTLKFSNGEPFDAEAAAENFRAVLDNRQRHAWLELANQIVDVKALSKTEQITRKSAYYPFLQELALPVLSVLSLPRSLKTMKP